MADRYWVGGSGNWNATAGTKWATTSGGAGGAAVPTAADDVYIDLGAGVVTVTIPASTTVVCRSLNFVDGTGGAFTGSFQFAATTSVLTIGDATAGAGNNALKVATGMTVTLTAIGTINFVSTSGTQQTITTNGKTMPHMTFGGAGSSYVLGGTLTSSGALTLNNGTFDTANYSMTLSSLSVGASNTRTLTLGSSSITCTATSTAFSFGSLPGLTMTPNTATVTCTGAVASFNNVFVINSFNWQGLSFVISGGGQGQLNISGATIGSLTITGAAAKTGAYIINGSFTCGAFTINPNSTENSLLISSSTRGTPVTITASSLTASNRVDFMDITGGGAATWTTAASGATYFGDAGGNSNITFTTPITCYVIGSSSMNWSDTTRFSSTSGGSGSTARVPLPQDSVVLDSNTVFTSGRTITLDMPRMGKDISISGVGAGGGTAPNFTASQGIDIFGSWSNDGTVTNTFSTVNFTFSGRGTHTLNFGGQAFVNTSFVHNHPGGTYTYNSAMTTNASGNWSQTNGSVNTNGYTVTAGIFASNNSNTRSLTTGSSTFASLTTSAGTVFNFATATGFTLSATSATMTWVSSTNSRTFNLAAGLTWGTLDYSNSGSTGALAMVCAGTLNVLKFSDATNARTMTISTASTNNIKDWSGVFGTSGKNMTINSNVGGTQRTISIPATTVQTVNYCTFQDIKIIQPYKIFATNSTNTSNNTNITFSAAPSAPLHRQSNFSTGSGTSQSASFANTTAPGDLLVATLTTYSAVSSLVPPTGFTLAKQANQGTSVYIYVYYKVADGTETSITYSWTTSVSNDLTIEEWYNWSGTPTLDTTDSNGSASGVTTLSTGSGATNSSQPGLSLAWLGGSSFLGAETAVPTNSFQSDYTNTAGRQIHAALPLTSVASRTTTFSWTSSRVPVSVLVNFVTTSTATGNFFLFF